MRRKGYMLCRWIDGELHAYCDESTVSMNWSAAYGYIWWDNPPVHYQRYFQGHLPPGFLSPCKERLDVFIVRVNSKQAPLAVDFHKRDCPRARKGNYFFSRR